MKKIIQSVRGTRDFYPPQMAVRRRLYQLIEEVSGSFGYQEYDGPFIEKIDLYAAKSGEEIVKEQAFVFSDRGGELVALRPELTPSLARMIAEKQNELVYPLRWWSFGPFWRYEKPQKGRSREFFQWNIDMIGANSASGDAEMIAICANFLKKAGLTANQVVIKVNHRKLIEEQIALAGINSDQRKDVFRLIDRLDKLSRNNWLALGKDMNLTDEQLSKIELMLTDEELWRHSPELEDIFSLLHVYGVADYVKYDAKIVRGLDYYTGTVFEAWDADKDGRAILGGGHYGNLIADVGGDSLAGVGFAMGDVMVTLLLEKYGCIPEILPFSDSVLVTIFDEESLKASIALSAQLRTAGLKVICYPEPAKLQKQLKFADRLQIKIVVVLGPEEISAGNVSIKNLVQRTQVTVPFEMASATIYSLLATL